MTSAYVLIVAILVLGGLLAALGDRLGSRVGKARLKLFNLRPKQTAIVVTIVTGTMISASTLGILFATSESLRQGVFRLDEILEKRREALNELQRVTEDKAEIEEEKELVSQELRRVDREKNQVKQELSSAKLEQAEVQQRLTDINQDFQQAKQQLRSVSQQATELRSEIKTLISERQQLLQQREQLQANIAQLLEQVQQRDRELSKRDRTIAQREQQILAQNEMLQEQNQKIATQDQAIAEGKLRLDELQSTLEAEISKRDTRIAQLDTAISERDRALQDRETRLNNIQTTLEAEIAKRDVAIQKLDSAIATRDNVLQQREGRLQDLEQQLNYLQREVAVLEQYYQNYQALRQGNVALMRGQVLAFGAVRIVEPTAARNAVDSLLRQANREAVEATHTPNETVNERVVQITEAQVEQIVEQIKDGDDYVVRILSAGNYVRGEKRVRVFADVARNEAIFNAGEVVAAVSIEPDNMNSEEIQQRLDLLLAASQFRARRAGVLGDIQVGDGKITTLIRFMEQVNTSQIPLDQIKAVASEKAETAGGLRLQLVALQNGKIIFTS